MKVVLFCGGMGMRLYPTTEDIPKPLVPIGEKPVLWHLMKYYSYYGHTDFVLCLGYKGELIRKYFINYDECLINDFVLSNGGKTRKVLKKDIMDWSITFVDTGLNSNVGQRLKAVQKYVERDEIFLANYSDAVSDLRLPDQIQFFAKHNRTGCLLTVRPFYSYHTVSTNLSGNVTGIRPIAQSKIRLNGGYFVFKNTIFDYIHSGEELVEAPFARLIKKNELVAYKYDGFWANMDTYKDKQRLDELCSKGKAAWQVWESPS